ncbi:hypothetical protein BC629DRAFT_411220 [Irpex lacteus]|nr:hypothetical protein BC629DRAFT_411220 [Irpex lacteus]
MLVPCQFQVHVLNLNSEAHAQHTITSIGAHKFSLSRRSIHANHSSVSRQDSKYFYCSFNIFDETTRCVSERHAVGACMETVSVPQNTAKRYVSSMCFTTACFIIPKMIFARILRGCMPLFSNLPPSPDHAPDHTIILHTLAQTSTQTPASP